MYLTHLTLITNSRLRFTYKPEALAAAKFFSNWLKFWGNKCTDQGAKRIIEKNKQKYIDLLPGKTHKCYNKWINESKQLGLI